MKKLIALILALVLTFCLCGCFGNDEKTIYDGVSKSESAKDETSSDDETTSKFEVIVTDQNDSPVKGVMVQICKDVCTPAMTDENGVAVFNTVITDEHKLSVMSCPEGYEYTGEEEIYLEDDLTSYTIVLNNTIA